MNRTLAFEQLFLHFCGLTCFTYRGPPSRQPSLAGEVGGVGVHLLQHLHHCGQAVIVREQDVGVTEGVLLIHPAHAHPLPLQATVTAAGAVRVPQTVVEAEAQEGAGLGMEPGVSQLHPTGGELPLDYFLGRVQHDPVQLSLGL